MINKYAEIQDRILLYNACKGILRIKTAKDTSVPDTDTDTVSSVSDKPWYVPWCKSGLHTLAIGTGAYIGGKYGNKIDTVGGHNTTTPMFTVLGATAGGLGGHALYSLLAPKD